MTRTVAAIATPPGHGGISVIRISGPRAREVVQTVFKPVGPSVEPAHQAVLCSWRVHSGLCIDPDTDDILDEVLVTFFKAPRSYTGEDTVEISCHGNPVITETLMQALLRQGVDLAGPGEFTRRAFQNGRIDLSRAEAVAAMTMAASRADAKLALKLLRGGLSGPVCRIRDQVRALLTRIELDLDFPDESVPMPVCDGNNWVETIVTALETLVSAGDDGDRMRGGHNIVLAGRVNAGKSSVFNQLMNRDRAIVSDEPGTTRDILEANPEWSAYAITLIDTAGYRNTESTAEILAMQRTADALKTADLIVYVMDSVTPDIDLLADVIHTDGDTPVIVFWNKTDIGPEPGQSQQHRVSGMRSIQQIICGSAKTGTGIDTLRQTIIAHVTHGAGNPSGQVLMLSLRQKNALQLARDAAYDAAQVVHRGDGFECMVPALQSADYHLGSIIGDTTPPDVLGSIFSEFCIGK
ncbi:tRNA uridine-5-carboxymethylaminomethyl(34) synthesis GTPase MnmE [bacterium]|nr:tRNA uridine-5-carboxymethylaminomethyl(34) synthesis GTPase MnmE [candidate division CSSED10-310 bacterium]